VVGTNVYRDIKMKRVDEKVTSNESKVAILVPNVALINTGI
jgi:hypothetical protein